MTLIDTVPDAWLPAPDLLLSELLEEEPSPDLVSEAISRRRAVVVFKLDPPEAYSEARVNADRLSEALRIFQSLIKHAYSKGASSMTDQWRRFFGAGDAYTMQVFAFSPGSFRVHMQAKDGSDLSGLSALGVALGKVDELTSRLDNPDATLEIVKENRGHVIGAYQALLRFVVEQGTPFEYAWADLGSRNTRGRRISPERAAKLYEALMARMELSKEEIALVGAFSKVDEVGGTWTMRIGDSERHGELADGVGNLLFGVTIGAKLYRAACEERLEEIAGSGRQRVRLLMYELKEATSAIPPAI